MLFKRDKSVAMSLPEPRLVHGVEIKKVPSGKYIAALQAREDLFAEILDKCFPGKSFEDVAAMFTSATRDTVVYVAGRLLVTAPGMIISMLCKLLDVDYETAINTWTPKEALDIGTAFWEMNDLTDFFANALELIRSMLPAPNTGSSAS